LGADVLASMTAPMPETESRGKGKFAGSIEFVRAPRHLRVLTQRAPEAPKTRADCEAVERPCPFVACAHNLFLDVLEKSDAAPYGKIRTYRASPSEMDPASSCALDIAERGEHTCEEVAQFFPVSAERIRQLDVQAKAKIKANATAELLDALDLIEEEGDAAAETDEPTTPRKDGTEMLLNGLSHQKKSDDAIRRELLGALDPGALDVAELARTVAEPVARVRGIMLALERSGDAYQGEEDGAWHRGRKPDERDEAEDIEEAEAEDTATASEPETQETPQKRDLAAIKAQIVDLLRASPQPLAEIAERLGIDRVTAHRAYTAMKARNRVRSVGGRWELVSQGSAGPGKPGVIEIDRPKPSPGAVPSRETPPTSPRERPRPDTRAPWEDESREPSRPPTRRASAEGDEPSKRRGGWPKGRKRGPRPVAVEPSSALPKRTDARADAIHSVARSLARYLEEQLARGA
jgi:hypothetical protein